MEKAKFEKKSKTEREPEEFNPERIDKMMAVRHKNAVKMLEIEEMLTQDVMSSDFISINSHENRELLDDIEKKYDELDIRYNKKIRREQFMQAVNRYLLQKVKGQQQEIDLLIEMKNSGDYKRRDHIDMGDFIFRQRVDKKSKRAVSAQQMEGYFAICFEDSSDFSHFSKGEISEADLEKSKSIGGRYHQAVSLPDVDNIKVLLVNDLNDLERIIAHERQHFFNDVAFGDFKITENKSEGRIPNVFSALRESQLRHIGEHTEGIVEVYLRDIKDELLAYIRDGSGAKRAVGFWNNKELYSYLRDGFSEEEKQDVDKLMHHIENELKGVLPYFCSSQKRAVLVFQLIDVPLVEIPTILNRMKKFYRHQVDRLMIYAPSPRLTEEQRNKNPELVKKLRDLNFDIAINARKGFHYMFDNAYNDDDIDAIENRSKKLREEYDELYAQL